MSHNNLIYLIFSWILKKKTSHYVIKTIKTKHPLLYIAIISTKSYIYKVNLKYLWKLFCFSLIFKAIISIFSYVILSASLCTIETINILIMLALVIYYTLNIVKNSTFQNNTKGSHTTFFIFSCFMDMKKKECKKNAIVITIHIILTLLILTIFWKVIILCLPYLGVYNVFFSLDENFLLMENDNSSDNKSSSNTSSYGDEKGDKPGKPNKPNLTIKVGPQNELEKVQLKKAMCTHDNMSDLVMNSIEEVESTMCDFAGDISEGKSGYHKALDSVTDHAFVCDNCHAICCKDCYEEYSSGDNTPTPHIEKGDSSNNKN